MALFEQRVAVSFAYLIKRQPPDTFGHSQKKKRIFRPTLGTITKELRDL